ncbi:GIY-YIG nuclease family protein [Streptomyces xanthophaeus]|uniref:GIY-YIG nuclease family protein n=1 Tax=Streptomyces xanthophaeus TaxID=67385 RepID=UPI0039903336
MTPGSIDIPRPGDAVTFTPKDTMMREGSPFVPRQIKDERSGVRPSAASLIDLVDSTEAAFPHVASILKQMSEAGVELDAGVIAIAVKMGRHAFATEARKRQAPPDRRNIVYYVKRGDLIKIGTTGSPVKRFEALMPDEILAFEPGNADLEAKRHLQFADSRATRRSEYFQPSDQLTAHIKALRAEHGAPDPEWRSVATMRSGYRRSRERVELPKPGKELVTATDGAKALQMNRSTVQGWVHRKLISPLDRDPKGRPLYCLGQMRFLIERNRAWQNHRAVTG